jgi:hypothetical protein
MRHRSDYNTIQNILILLLDGATFFSLWLTPRPQMPARCSIPESQRKNGPDLATEERIVPDPEFVILVGAPNQTWNLSSSASSFNNLDTSTRAFFQNYLEVHPSLPP